MPIQITDRINEAIDKTNSLKFAPHEETISLNEIVPNPENTFAVEDTEESIQELAEDIKENGLMTRLL